MVVFHINFCFPSNLTHLKRKAKRNFNLQIFLPQTLIIREYYSKTYYCNNLDLYNVFELSKDVNLAEISKHSASNKKHFCCTRA